MLLYNIQWIFIFCKLLAPELIDDRNLETETKTKTIETLSTLALVNKIKAPFAARPWVTYKICHHCVENLRGVFVCKFSFVKRENDEKNGFIHTNEM